MRALARTFIAMAEAGVQLHSDEEAGTSPPRLIPDGRLNARQSPHGPVSAAEPARQRASDTARASEK